MGWLDLDGRFKLVGSHALVRQPEWSGLCNLPQNPKTLAAVILPELLMQNPLPAKTASKAGLIKLFPHKTNVG